MNKWFSILFLSLICFALRAQPNLNTCITSKSHKIVVLGSSTAAGAGASQIDSSWVARYRFALKQINPNNEVINLAVGGFTTYRIMPNGFVSPPNRPAVDTLKNITQALSLNPDAIIVNLPSNDKQWPMQEQLNNFDSLYNHSWSQGVPIFICTTQPIVPLNFALYQKSVRDSILNKYGTFAIDLFTSLADTNLSINPLYAADAVHLNDTGHAIVFNEIWQADVLNKIYQPYLGTDLALIELLLPQNQCADTLGFNLVVANLGDTLHGGIFGYVLAQGASTDSVPLQINQSLLPCQKDTLSFSINLSTIGQYNLNVHIDLSGDTLTNNNELSSSFTTVKQAIINSFSDILCKGDLAQFSATLIQGDTLLWYKNSSDTLPILYQNQVFTLQNDTSLFVQAITGDLAFKKELKTLDIGNVNFNGNMFNLIAKDTITLKSLAIKLQSAGSQGVLVYFKQGPYQGFENQPNSWNLHHQDTLNTTGIGQFVGFDIPKFKLNAGDTLGVYIHMAQSNKNLVYQTTNSVATYETQHLKFQSGSGVSYNFGASNFPNRILNLEVNYLHGFNRLGQCASSIVEVHQVVGSDPIFLGNDTAISITSGITLQSNTHHTNPIWLDGLTLDTLSTQSSWTLDNTFLPSSTSSNTDIQLIYIADNQWGCVETDTLLVTFLYDIGIREFKSSYFRLFPNPSEEYLNIFTGENIQEIELFDLTANKLIELKADSKQVVLDISGLSAGSYIIMVKSSNFIFWERIIKK